MSSLALIQKKIPGYTENDWKFYTFWHQHLDVLDYMLDSVSKVVNVPETEAEALRRLGKIEFLLRIQQIVADTKKVIKLITEKQETKNGKI